MSKKIDSKSDPDAEAKLLVSDLQREMQNLRLALEEKDKTLETVRHDLAVQTKNAEDHIARVVDASLEQLFTEIGGSVIHLVTQDYLSNTQGKNLQTKDVLVTANRLVDCLKSHGLEVIGNIGDTEIFDPQKHEVLSLDEKLEDGNAVNIRMVGLAFRGKILRRIAVTRQPAQE